MFPAAKDIIGNRVEVVTTMFVTIIVVVTAGETVTNSRVQSRFYSSSYLYELYFLSLFLLT